MILDVQPIMSGKRKGLLATLARGGLRLASTVYGLVVVTRNRSFDKGSRSIQHCGVPVISVGNITTGGTGKTPIVCFLARWFRQHGVRVAIVSRGYGRGQEDANDEALELYDRLPDVPHVQDVDRVEAARVATEELEAQLILMDDGFQHRRLYRDLDLVVIDATCPFGFGYLLPRGLLREPLDGLARADLVVLSRCDLVDPSELKAIEQRIHAYHPDVSIVRCRHQPASLFEYPDHTVSLDAIKDSRVALVSAIGNPDAFARTVASCGAEVIATRQLTDHDPYEPATVQQLRQWVESLGNRVDQVVCTHKDLVKLRTDRLGGKPLRALIIELAIESNQQALTQAIEELQVYSP